MVIFISGLRFRGYRSCPETFRVQENSTESGRDLSSPSFEVVDGSMPGSPEICPRVVLVSSHQPRSKYQIYLTKRCKRPGAHQYDSGGPLGSN